MAKTGYLFLAKGYKAREEDIAWMKEFGCDEGVLGVQREGAERQGECDDDVSFHCLTVFWLM